MSEKKPGRGGAGRGQGRKKGVPNKTTAIKEKAKALALEQAVEEIALSEKAVLEELAKLGFSNMLDFITIGPDGLPYHDFSKMTRAQAAAIGELTVETHHEIQPDGEGGKVLVPVRKVKFKLANKTPALDLLGRHFGSWKERIEDPNKKGGLSAAISDLDRAKALALFIAKTRAQPKPGTPPTDPKA
jgi:phage terminase small subunit